MGKRKKPKGHGENRVVFTKPMRRTHTILLPEMLPLHFEMIKNILQERGYKAELLHNKGAHIAQLGLQYVHNDTCYPALLVIGQMIDALQSGKYDLEHTALLITQTGGGCRASNYIHLLRKALKTAGYGHVPVISLNLNGMEKNPGFKLTLSMARKMIAALMYGDELMLLSNQVRPYEKTPGETDALIEKWTGDISGLFRIGQGYGLLQMKKVMGDIARSFDRIEREPRPTIKVGIVGEIYVKYAALGNNGLEAFLQSQGCEYMVPGVLGFGMYIIENNLEERNLYGGSRVKDRLVHIGKWYVCKVEKALIQAVSQTSLRPPCYFSHTKSLAKGVISYGSKMGEGWLLTAEMLELIESGYPNIICAQPFGCLPNHINGRGMMNRVKEIAPHANIVAIDYDPSASRVNQENRIKLMLASAASGEEALS